MRKFNQHILIKAVFIRLYVFKTSCSSKQAKMTSQPQYVLDSAPPKSPAGGHGGSTNKIYCECQQKAEICWQTPGECPLLPQAPDPTKQTAPRIKNIIIAYYCIIFVQIYVLYLSWDLDVLFQHSKVFVEILMVLRQNLDACSHGLIQGVVVIWGRLPDALKLLLLQLVEVIRPTVGFLFQQSTD